MNFIINTPVDSLTTMTDLTDYIQHLADQVPAVTLRLVVAQEQVAEVQPVLQDAPVPVEVVTDDQVATLQGDYLINMRVTDRLLPGALAQIQAVLVAHPTDLVTTSFLSPEEDLERNLTDYLTKRYSAEFLASLPPIQAAQLADRDLATWSMADKLAVLPMVQRYLVATKNDRFVRLTRRLWPYGNVLRIAALNPNLPAISISQQIHLIQQAENVVRLGVPVLVSDRRIIKPVQLTDELLAGIQAPQTIAFTNQYHPYVIKMLNQILETPTFTALSAEQQRSVRDKITTSLDATEGYAASEIK